VCGIQISQKELGFKEGILSVPFYLVSQIPRLIRELPLDYTEHDSKIGL
jgi:hypothetical protein